MSNASTVRRQVSGTQQLTIASLPVATAATESQFLLNNNALTLTGGGTIPLSAGVTGLYAGTGQVIQIHIAGTLIGGTATGTLGINLYVVPAASLPIAATVVTAAALVTAGATKIATGSVGTLGTGETAGAFSLDAFVQLDGANNLQGWFQSQTFGSTTGAKTAIGGSNTVIALTGEADLNFVAAAVTTTETTGTITLDEFSLSLV